MSLHICPVSPVYLFWCVAKRTCGPAQVDRRMPAVNPAEVRQFGLVLSRFSFDGYANDSYRQALLLLMSCHFF